MKHQRVIQDHSMELGQALLNMVAPHYPVEKHADLFAAFHQLCTRAFQHFDNDIARIERHVNPRFWN